MSSFDRVRTDFTQATRVLRSSPGFAALVVATLAVGIGLSLAMASIVDTVLVRPLDVVEPDRLIRIWARDTESGAQHLDATVSDFEDYRQRAEVLASLAALSVTRTGLADDTGRPTNVTVGRVMGDWTATVGTRPALGRSFTAQEQADGGQVAMLAYRYWQERHGGSPDIVGSTVRLDDVPYEIIGVLPATWAYPRAVQVWRPFDREELAYRDDDRELAVLARMRHDTEVAAVSSEIDRLAAVARQERPQENENIEAWAEPMHAELVRDVETPLLMLAGAVAVVLLITCANTAGLMLARGSAREHEMAIRGALGAGRRDLVRQVLIESLLLAAMGGAFGVAAAAVALDVIVAVAPAELPFAAAIGVDGRTVVVAVAITLLTGVAFGLLPAWRAAAGTGTLRAGTRTSSRFTGGQRTLVVVELALAVVLAVGGGLLLRSFDQLLRVERGFEPARVLAVGVGMPDALHGENPLLLYDRVRAEVASLPGVEAVAYGRTHPLDPYGLNFRVLGARGFPTTDASAPAAVVRMVSPGYFRTAAIPLRAGRSFRDEDDGDSRRVAIVTESFGQAFYGAASPVGETFEIPWGRRPG